mmetsp:Transcript_6889/g.42037  ORF Transcript_6889/g.42037 Transcript_6889/m.42037 type:complete len:203 (-) Transcript_6889:437-1045(-)
MGTPRFVRNSSDTSNGLLLVLRTPRTHPSVRDASMHFARRIFRPVELDGSACHCSLCNDCTYTCGRTYTTLCHSKGSTLQVRTTCACPSIQSAHGRSRRARRRGNVLRARASPFRGRRAGFRRRRRLRCGRRRWETCADPKPSWRKHDFQRRADRFERLSSARTWMEQVCAKYAGQDKRPRLGHGPRLWRRRRIWLRRWHGS